MSRLLIVAFDPMEADTCAGFAQAMAVPFDILSLQGPCAADLGAERILCGNLTEVPPADGMAKALAAHAPGYTHIAGLSSMQGKDVLARLAGILDASMITDAIAIESPTVFKRPMVAGSIIATVEALSFPILLTVRPAGFPKPKRGGQSAPEAVAIEGASKTKRIAVSAASGSRPDLSQAKIVVTGGRPLKDAETYERVIGGLADALGGATGATRAAVDSGIAPNESQVGQTGKIVAPDLYIAAGVSGSTQHMAGIKDSKIIVAINKDADAPIFDAADYGLVADLYDAIPAIREKLGK